MYLASESGPRPSEGWGGVGEGMGVCRDSTGDRTGLYLWWWWLQGSMYLSKRIDVNKRKMTCHTSKNVQAVFTVYDLIVSKKELYWY